MNASEVSALHPMRAKTGRCTLVRSLTAAMFLITSVGLARAQFVAGGGMDAPLIFSQEFKWKWPAVTMAHIRANWGRILTDTPGLAGSRNLTVKVRHEKRPPGHPPAEPQPNGFITLITPGIERPVGLGVRVVTDAAQRAHGGHWDTAYVTVNALGAGIAAPMDATIITEGTHTADRPCILKYRHRWRYYFRLILQALFRDSTGSIVTGDYFGFYAALPEEMRCEPLPTEMLGMPLAGVTMVMEGATRSTTTLAYVGQVDDQPTLMNLGLGAALFTANGAVPVPFFYAEEQDLHIAVNLTQYEGARTHVVNGQQCFFQNGVCENLPGVLVSHVPISFDPNAGFHSEVPYTGLLTVEGEVGGQMMPAISGRVTLAGHATNAAPLAFKIRASQSHAEYDAIIRTAADGSYEITGLPSGSYDIWVKGEKWLAQSVHVDMPEPQPDGPVVTEVDLTLLSGDANDNNIVDVEDLSLFIQAFDATPDAPNWIESADFNGDSLVDILDLALLISTFDQVGAPDPDGGA